MEDPADQSLGCVRTIFTIGHSTRTFSDLLPCFEKFGSNCWSTYVRFHARGRIRSSTSMFCRRRSPRPEWPTASYRRSAAGANTARTRCLSPILFGGTRPSEIMPTTPGLRRSGRDLSNWRHCLATSVAPSCAPSRVVALPPSNYSGLPAGRRDPSGPPHGTRQARSRESDSWS